MQGLIIRQKALAALVSLAADEAPADEGHAANLGRVA